MERGLKILKVIPGALPKPFIQEYGPFVWGHDECDSDGDCGHPLDRQWSELFHRDRRGAAVFEIYPAPSSRPLSCLSTTLPAPSRTWSSVWRW